MSIQREMVEKIAHLARLRIGEEEKETFAQQLALILDYANSLNQIPTEGVEPLSHVLPVQNVFREDRVDPSLPREAVLGSEEYFRVPQVMDDSSV